MVQRPQNLNKHYYDLFVRMLNAAIPTYDDAEKGLTSRQGTIQMVLGNDAIGQPIITMGTVSPQSDHVHFRDPLSTDKSDPQVEAVVQMLAEKLAATIEALIKQTALKGTVGCFDSGIRNPNSIRVQVRAAASCSQISTKPGASSQPYRLVISQ